MSLNPMLHPMLRRIALGAALAGSFVPGTLVAQTRPSLADRFPIGSDPMVLCSAQLDRRDRVASGIFDRAYSLTCRDARLPVGRLYVLRTDSADAASRLAAARSGRAQCGDPQPVFIAGLEGVVVRNCRSLELGVDYVAYEASEGREFHVAEGLKGYDPALQLALRTIVLDRRVEGEVPLATAGPDDSGAFARTVAGTLDPFTTRGEGYRSNFGAQYLEAAEYFGGLRDRLAGTGLSADEISLNQALQQSNIGNFAAAERLFAESVGSADDPLLGRLRRNYLALHLLNQGLVDAAIAEAQRPIVGADPTEALSAGVIDESTAGRLNSENVFVQTLSRAEPPPLTRSERFAILDAQAAHIAGAAMRIAGRAGDAQALLAPSLQTLEGLRGGRVTSVYWLRAQILDELAAIDLQQQNFASAEARLREAARLVAAELPGTSAEWLARLRLAGYLADRGQDAEALSIFQTTVHNAVEGGETNALRDNIAPYFRLLEGKSFDDPAVIDEFFFASQALVRLGVARSQYEFARILTNGGDEAAALFRTSSQISREINRLRLESARLENLAPEGADRDRAQAELASTIAELEAQQTAAQARLNNSARYQVTTMHPVSLAELRAVLGANEVYYKLFFVDGGAHAVVVTKDRARIVPLTVDEAAVTQAAARLRDSIRKEVGGQTFVPAFDVETAYSLYQAILTPIAAELQTAKHLIFEPDGALLSLPLDLLVTERSGVDAYLARARDPAGDPYDYRGISWLGRDLAMSTTVSPRTLHLIRSFRPPSAPRAYLGLGENAPVANMQQVVVTAEGAVCTLPAQAWSQPIDADELQLARSKVGATSDIVTGSAFTDTAVRSRDDLDEYRILHFATHGLVTPPGRECLPQPALLTSWGGPGSDGLLSFQEVFSLSINADVVILSACDTAAAASLETTRLLGEMTGGGFALDGLVRAFMGAGARAVVASHWPVPEEPIDATTELIGNLFAAGAGRPISDALRDAQRGLMDRAETSHPYYWAAFAIIGDGAQPLIASN